MELGEATRQYQATLEAERRTREFFDGIFSAEDELDEAAKELAKSRAAMESAWCERR